jgi:hypothetical protein
MSECCGGTPSCLSGNITGTINFIIENRPFNASGDCCDVLCSGHLSAGYSQYGTEHPGVNPRDNGVEYLSIDDGVGGFLETVSGCTVRQDAQCTGYEPDCCPFTGSEVGEKGGGCYSWTQGGSKTITCTTTTTALYCAPDTYWSNFCQLTAGGNWCLNTYGDSCTITPYALYCHCVSSGWIPSCNPFEWDETSCRFTGNLYNNDTGCSQRTASAHIYFDDCLAQWVIHTDWSGSASQWSNGQTFYADCANCSGLDRCHVTQKMNSYRYGSYSPSSGPAVATVCVDQRRCGSPTLKTSGKADIPPNEYSRFEACE